MWLNNLIFLGKQISRIGDTICAGQLPATPSVNAFYENAGLLARSIYCTVNAAE
jgi:hypothetical protein